MFDFANLEITLEKGSHESAAAGMCFMEAVAFFNGEPHSDHPKCVSPVLMSFGIALNDRLGGANRQLLRQYIPRVVGTVGSHEQELERGYVFAQAAGEKFLAPMLRSSGFNTHADAVCAAFGKRDWNAAADSANTAYVAANTAARATKATAYAAAAALAASAAAPATVAAVAAAYAAAAALAASAAAPAAAAAAYAAYAAAISMDDILAVFDEAIAAGPSSPFAFARPIDESVRRLRELA